MITPADDFDDGPDLDRPDPDDPLTVILRPAQGRLAPPPGRFEEIRRGAVRRRVLRTAAGVGATCAVAALAVLLPLRLTAQESPARPTVPLAPPPVSGSPSTGTDASTGPDPSTVPSPSTAQDQSATPAPSMPTPSKDSGTPGVRDATDSPSAVPDSVRSSTTAGAPSEAPSASSPRR
ncbi:hypothetical protein [Streptomyces sp. NPDC096132]|uniref:hypothetical protein n=1 Tax=Streptomyces sp. NPDC096132 TaxID=3366075 RepID=UPI00382DBC31